MKRIIEFILIGLGFILIAFIFYVSSTASGLVLLARIANSQFSSHLNIDIESGSLTRAVVIRHFSFSNSDVKIEADNVHLNVNLWSLLQGTLQVKSLTTDNLDITVLPTPNTPDTTPPEFIIPVRLAINNLVVQKLKIITTTSQVITNIHLSGTAAKNKVQLQQLTFDRNNVHYQMQGNINLDPIDINFAIQLQQAQTSLLNVTINGRGDWQHLPIQFNFTAPLVAQAQLDLKNILTQLQWKLTGHITQIDPNRFNIPLQNSPFTGDLAAHGTLNELAANLGLHSQNHPDNKIDLTFASKNLTTQQFMSTLSWQNLTIAATAKNNYLSPRGTISAQGKLQHYQFTSQFEIAGDNFPDSSWAIQGTGNNHNVNFTKMNAELLQGNLNATGRIDWRKDLQYQFSIQAEKLNPGQHWAGWAGIINFDTEITYNNQILNINLAQLQGKLHGEPLQGQAALRLVKSHLEQLTLAASLGKAVAQINFVQHKNIDLQWDIHIPELTKVSLYLIGSIDSTGTATGSVDKPVVQGKLTATNLRWLANRIDQLTSQFYIDLTGKTSSTVNLAGQNILVNNYLINQLSSTITGTPATHYIDVNALLDNTQLTLAATGHYAPHYYALIGTKFELSSPNFDTWNLREPFKFIYKNGGWQLQHFYWVSAQQALTANVVVLPDGTLTNAMLNIDNVSVELFNTFLPDNIQVSGLFNAKVQISDKSSTPLGTMNANLQNAQISVTKQNDTRTWNIDVATLQANLQKNKLAGAVNISLNNREKLQLQMTLPKLNVKHLLTLDTVSQGSLNAQIYDISFLRVFFPQFTDLTGSFFAKLTWNGPIKQPNLQGKLALTGTAELPAAGLALKKLQLTANVNQDNFTYDLYAESGDGNVDVQGKTQIKADDFPTKLTIKGKDFTVDNLADYTVVASPDLVLTLNKEKIVLTGSLLVPSASIRMNNNTDIVTLPNETIIIDSSVQQGSFNINPIFYADIYLTLGNKIYFSGDNIKATLTGKLHIIEKPPQNTIATGQLIILSGTYNAFGQDLDIKNGKLIFAGGNIENPGIDVQATRTITTFVQGPAQSALSGSQAAVLNQAPLQQKTIVVGVSVSNTLQKPYLVLFSDQSGLSQADILSYLVLGAPLSSANSGQAAALVRIANALNTNGGDLSNAIQELKNKFGVTSVSVQDTSYLNTSTNTVSQNTSLVLSKTLSPRLMVRYSIGLLAPINTITTAYSLTEHLSAQAESSSIANGVDLIYSWSTK